MKDQSLNAIIDSSIYTDSLDLNLKNKLYKILDIVNSLYALQMSDTHLQGTETYKYKEIIDLLKSSTEYLPNKGSAKLNAQIKNIENGIYDLAAVEIETSEIAPYYLIIGKIVSQQDSQRYYSAVLSVEDSRFCGLIDDYKKEISLNYSRLSLVDMTELDHIEGLSNSFKCMIALRLSGFINKKHIPFSLFYSGKDKEQLSSLSNTVLFTNIYAKRFEAISENLGKKVIAPNIYIELTDRKLVEKILVLWLWGHDMGHFLKTDNFKNKNSKENKYAYDVVHELRSDVFSLYILKQLCGHFFGIKKELVYQVFVMEMLRYMRRADFYNQPDSVSACLIYRYMLYNTALSLHPGSNNIVLNYEEFGKMIDELLMVTLDFFKLGSFKEVFKFLSMLNIDGDFTNIEQNLELDLSLSDIPEFIKII